MIDHKRSETHGSLVVCLFSVTALAGAWVGAARAQADKQDNPSGTTAEKVVHQVSGFYKKAKSATVEVEQQQKIGPMSVKSALAVAFERPNRFAFRTKDGPTGLTVVSDGKTLYTSILAMQRYTEADAPESVADLAGDPIIAGMMQGLLAVNLFSPDPEKMLMDGVKTSKYAGLETLDGAKVHHLTFTQDQLDWEMWVAAEGDPFVLRVVTDMSKALANMPGAAKGNVRKLEISQTYKNWRIDPKLDDQAFAFQPPAGAKKVDTFFEGLGGGQEETLAALTGKTAPDVSLKRLEKGEFQLKDQRGEHIVMLDFWATWCGPCVQEMPILAQVAESYKDKGVVFCAVNQREKPEDIRKFLEAKKLKITVALDTDGKVGESYKVEGIPTLVLIDKQGVVQSVHVGYSPTIKTTLRKELDALLNGKDLAKEALAKAKEAKAAMKAEGLETAWSVSGAFTSAAATADGSTVFALQRQGRCLVLDREGKTTRTFALPDPQQAIIRVTRLPDGGEGLLAFRTWGPAVLACKTDGTKLWEEEGGQGIDEAAPADLDGDGVDEVIVGYNGGTGLHVFSAAGKRLWKRTDLANVWHVAAGDLDGDGKRDVVTTSAQGKVHVSAARDGQSLETFDPGFYANMIRVAPAGSVPGAKGDVVLVIGAAANGEEMAALASGGKTLWTLKFPDRAQHCESLEVSPNGVWAAVGLRGGKVCVVDLKRGQIVASAAGQGMLPIVAWASRAKGATPLLLVAGGGDLTAFHVNPAAPPAKSGQR